MTSHPAFCGITWGCNVNRTGIGCFRTDACRAITRLHYVPCSLCQEGWPVPSSGSSLSLNPRGKAAQGRAAALSSPRPVCRMDEESASDPVNHPRLPGSLSCRLASPSLCGQQAPGHTLKEPGGHSQHLVRTQQLRGQEHGAWRGKDPNGWCFGDSDST